LLDYNTRITAEEVTQAAAKTGLRLIYGSFGTGHDCGCPQMLLYLAEGGQLPAIDTPDVDEEDYRLACGNAVTAWADQKYGTPYALAFRMAFDSNTEPPADTIPHAIQEGDGGPFMFGMLRADYDALPPHFQRYARDRWTDGVKDGRTVRRELIPNRPAV
jgi:hypothetical protein